MTQTTLNNDTKFLAKLKAKTAIPECRRRFQENKTRIKQFQGQSR